MNPTNLSNMTDNKLIVGAVLGIMLYPYGVLSPLSVILGIMVGQNGDLLYFFPAPVKPIRLFQAGNERSSTPPWAFLYVTHCISLLLWRSIFSHGFY